MGECRTCPKEKRLVVEGQYRSAKQARYNSRTSNNTYNKPYRGDCYPVKNCDTCGLSCCKPTRCGPCLDSCLERPLRCGCSLCAEPCLERPRRCSPCFDTRLERPRRCSPCLDPCLERPGRCSPCLDPRLDWTGRCDPCLDPCLDSCNYCPENRDSGVLHAIRNGFRRIFTGRKRTTQLKFLERQLVKLEDEASCVECAVKEAFDCGLQVSCSDLRCSLTAMAEKLGCLRSDLSYAYDCYDPCRDKCEVELICCLQERVDCLEVLLNDLYLQLECLQYQAGYGPRLCKPGCRKPTCCSPCKPQCAPMCQKPCCAPRKRCKPNLCRKSSVIPLGVMLVKL